MSFDRWVSLLVLTSLSSIACAAPAQGGSRDAVSGVPEPRPAGETPARPAEGSPSMASPGSKAEPARTSSGDELANTGFLSSIPLRGSEPARAWIAKSADDEDFARSLRVRLQVMRAYENAGELSRRSKLPLVNGTFQISDLSQLESRDAPTKEHLKSSFVIDYEEPSLRAPVEELEKSGERKTPNEIASFVGRYIREKSYARSFDVASRVASTRSGDCTEHAVLTTALLRRFGFRARVILGIVLVGVSGGDVPPTLRAFGHAWVEHYDHDRWRIVDAALGGPECARASDRPTVCGVPAGATRRVAYLPINALKDETVSFGRALMDQPGVESVVRVEVDVTAAR